jgi:ceramide glucosyltransferase
MIFLILAAIGTGIALLQALVILVPRGSRRPSALPPMSILKPLAGLDDALADNLERFCHLDYPDYELILGVKDAHDPAFPIALSLMRRHPERVRLAIQRGEPGYNPKVNQLITLAAVARHDVLVVSDSNTRTSRSYLRDIAAHLEDDVGIVTHVVAGSGERTLGAAMDNLHLSTTIGPGVLAAKAIARKDVVVGKSMALRMSDLRALGGFETFKDVLAEDYLIGRAIRARLKKRVAIGTTRVWSVSRSKTVAQFFDRYCRWSVMHRHAVGRWIYAAELLLCPISLAALGALISPSHWQAAAAIALVKLGIDCAVARASRTQAIGVEHLLALVLKDAALCLALVHGFFANEVTWRGHALRVTGGTRLVPLAAAEAEVLT